ncbi:lanthionine synthetase LanC family protein [Kribbella sp. HUAS MG21]|uniref:Lanthionine synthetase LanC family protein n=1 Tax=Kribbella sp. HUAS MG21 TaxID=3160966 RepID=A0AAU7TGS9_9ACTN
MRYGEVAERSWSWVLGQVRWDDDGPWIPEAGDGEKPDEYVAGMHSGVGGLGHVLAEIKLGRPWTPAEQELAEGIAARIRGAIPADTTITFFDGLVSYIGSLTALGEPGSAAALDRLAALVDDEHGGWAQSFLEPPKYHENARCNDATLGTASVLMGALWALRQSPNVTARRLGGWSADWLLAEQEVTPAGLNWLFVPRRFYTVEPTEMPNFSHGLAGIVAVLAVAGVELDRPELVDAARRGAEHLVTIGITDEKGFRVPRVIPWSERHGDEYTFNWCHGGAGTAAAFSALEYAAVPEIAGETPAIWRRRCLDSVRYSGIPERLHPGFWDNDGRCCGTAGVGDAFLDTWLRDGDERDLEFAGRLGDTLVDHARPEGYWRFVEHRNEDPLLPPGVGWMQGAAGIAAYLFRLQRAVDGDRRAVARMENWWTLTR